MGWGVNADGLESKAAAILSLRNEAGGESSRQQISDALVVQARQLLNLARLLRSDDPTEDICLFNLPEPESKSPPIFFQTDRTIEPDTRDLARKAYRERRLRDQIFGDLELFGEPGWDILLDLANASFSGVRVSVSSACVGACVPPTTGLRWISVLEKAGLVEREDDLLDGRRTYVKLTRKGLFKMEEYLRATNAF